MKILIAIGSIQENANTRIGKLIAREFKANNIDVDILCFDKNFSENDYKLINDFNTYIVGLKQKNSHLSIINRLKNSDKYNHFKKYVDYAQDICNKNKYDYLIGICAPFYETYRLFNKLKNIKKIYYQLDPFGYFYNFNGLNKKLAIKKEVKVIKESIATFTTFPLYKTYINDNRYKKYIDKIRPVNFPVFNSSNYKSNNSIDNDEYNIYYFGSIDDNFRNPKEILDFILKSSLNIKVHFYGSEDSKAINDYAYKYNKKVFNSHRISHDEVIKLMNDKSILLNINNLIPNQSPSKLIEYISTGNPIINVVQYEDEDSLRILGKYNNVFNYYVKGNNNIKDFDKFISNYRKTSKTEFDKDYKEFTSKYVASQFIEIINKLI